MKIKPLTKEQIIISIDRLTRFKDVETKYLRVFCDILTHNLISPQYKKSELEMMDYSVVTGMAEEVINYSLDLLGVKKDLNNEINKRILEYEKSIFNISAEVEKLLRNKINYLGCLELINDTTKLNLKWLQALVKDVNILTERKKEGLLYPLESVVIVEGATEEILLPEFAKICGFDFDKEGVFMISAGGKNQVVKLYYELSQCIKLPIYVLLDKDGIQNSREIEAKLRKNDFIHLLTCGEFEDLLPFDLIKRTLAYELKNISIIESEDFVDETPRVKFLEEVFKKRGMHEFKKVEFAQSVRKNISGINDITAEIRDIVEEIKNIKK